MKRRELITLVGVAAAAALRPFGLRAQQPNKIKHIGFLRVGPPPTAWIEGLRRGLREHGLIEDLNITFDFGLAQNATEVPAVAAELVRRKVDVLFASGTPSVLPARDAAAGRIPVVFVATFDPVVTGLVARLARPGGNITGMTSISGDVIAKRLQMTRELLPKLTKIAILVRRVQSDCTPVCAGIPGRGT